MSDLNRHTALVCPLTCGSITGMSFDLWFYHHELCPEQRLLNLVIINFVFLILPAMKKNNATKPWD